MLAHLLTSFCPSPLASSQRTVVSTAIITSRTTLLHCLLFRDFMHVGAAWAVMGE